MSTEFKRPEDCSGIEEFVEGRQIYLDGQRPNYQSRNYSKEASNYYEEVEYIGKHIPVGTSIYVFENFRSIGYFKTTHPIQLKSGMVWNHNENIVYVVWSTKNDVEIAFVVLRCNIV